MDSNVKIDQRLAEAVRIAVRDFGEGILGEERLMGVLKDYQGFRTFQQGEFIVRTLIADGTLSRLHVRLKTDSPKREEHLNRETQRIARQYGFSYSLIQTVIISFVWGMGIDMNKLISVDKDLNKPSTKKSISTISLTKSPTESSNTSKSKVTSPGTSVVTRKANGSSSSSNVHDNTMKLFLWSCIIFTVVVFGPVLVTRGCNGPEANSDEEYPIQVVVDSVEDINDTPIEYYYAIEAEAGEKYLKDLEQQTSTDPRTVTEQKPEVKKKPIDPRFQYPDGRYKQPSEYMKYFNEDDDDEDDAYEEGYEDGYDDALDEL